MKTFSSDPPLPVLTGKSDLDSFSKTAVENTANQRVRKRDVLRDVLIIAVVQFVSTVCLLFVLMYVLNIGEGRLLDTILTAVYCLVSILSYSGMGVLGRQPTRIRMRRLFYDAIIVELITIGIISTGKYDSWVTKGYEITITTLCTLCALAFSRKMSRN